MYICVLSRVGGFLLGKLVSILSNENKRMEVAFTSHSQTLCRNAIWRRKKCPWYDYYDWAHCCSNVNRLTYCLTGYRFFLLPAVFLSAITYAKMKTSPLKTEA